MSQTTEPSWSRPRRGLRWLLGLGILLLLVSVFLAGSWFSGSLLVERQERRWATELGELGDWPSPLADRETNQAAIRLARFASQLGLRISRRSPPESEPVFPAELIDARLAVISELTDLRVDQLPPLPPALADYLKTIARPLLATTQTLLRANEGIRWGLQRDELLRFRAREVDREGLVALHDLLVVVAIEDEREHAGSDGRRRFEAAARLLADFSPVGMRDIHASLHMKRNEASLARLLTKLPQECSFDLQLLRQQSSDAMAMRASLLHDVLLDTGSWQRALPMLEQLERPESLSHFLGDGLTRESFRAHRASTMMLLTRRRIHTLRGTKSREEPRDSGLFAPSLSTDVPTPRVLRAPSRDELAELIARLESLEVDLRISACIQRLRSTVYRSGQWPSAEEVSRWGLLPEGDTMSYRVGTDGSVHLTAAVPGLVASLPTELHLTR